MAAEELSRYGWNDYWAALMAEKCSTGGLDESEPGRVLRHDGVALSVATGNGITSVPLRRGLPVPPVVGDWVALREDRVQAVLPRRSLLERRAKGRGAGHPLVANVDRVLITCGLDRPLNPGRIERSATIAWEAGATPSIVLTKADLHPSDPDRGPDLDRVAGDLAAAHADLDVAVTSSLTGRGLDGLRRIIGRDTVALLGESGSGKSSLVNALAGEDVALTGDVRDHDRKGRHTTTARQLHPLPGGGVVVDTPGLRSIGIWAEGDAVGATFDDIAEVAAGCRFRDCSHETEPGCAVREAVARGHLDARRLEAFKALTDEASDRPLR